MALSLITGAFKDTASASLGIQPIVGRWAMFVRADSARIISACEGAISIGIGIGASTIRDINVLKASPSPQMYNLSTRVRQDAPVYLSHHLFKGEPVVNKVTHREKRREEESRGQERVDARTPPLVADEAFMGINRVGVYGERLSLHLYQA